MRTLPDYLREGLKLVIVGTNPGKVSAEKGHYYANPRNDFWKLLYDGGLVPKKLGCEDDKRLMDEYGIGLTDLAKRATPSEADLNGDEVTDGRIRLAADLEKYRPQVIAFNGKKAYKMFSRKRACELGLQAGKTSGAHVFVLPSTSRVNTGVPYEERKQYFKVLTEFLKRLSSEC